MELEPIKIIGIQKDISSRAIDKQGNRLVVNPLIDALNARYHVSETGEFESVQNIAGTISYDPGLPAGTNTTIGWVADREAGRLIFFNWNSNGNHGVYAWNPITNAFTTLIAKTLLNFSNNPRYRITGAGVIQNLLYWTDGLNPQRMINMTRDYSAITDDVCINLYKRPPVQGPTFTASSNDSTYKTSAIAGNIYQFATRYVFADNEVSALSMYSEFVLSHIDTLSSFSFNRHGITIYYQSEMAPIISKVQLLYRKNNSPDWYLYKEQLTSDFSGTSLLVYFYDDNSTTLIPSNEANKLYDAVPLLSKSLATFKNRNFVIADTEGYTVEQIQSYSLPTNVGIHDTKNLKDGGNWNYGPVYYDKDMRTPGITNFKKVAANYYAGNNLGVDGNNKTVMTPAFADNLHPSWAKYVTFAKTIEQNYEKYMQIPVKPMFYVGEGDLKDASGTAVPIGVAATPTANLEMYSNRKVYLNVLPDNVTAGKKFVHIHWQLPENIPFIPDDECLIRVITPLNNLAIGDTIPVIGFDGQSIITNNLKGGFDWTASGWNAHTMSYIVIEVFKIKKTQSKLLYEVGKYFSGFPVSAYGSFDFDSYNTNGVTSAFKFKNLKMDGKASDVCYDGDTGGNLFASINIESTTCVSNNYPIPESEQKVVFDAQPNNPFPLIDKTKDRTLSRNYAFPDSTPSVVPDYRRIPDYPGRPIAYDPNVKQLNRNTTVRYSETYIQDSMVNGLSSFDFLNEYPLPTYRTPVLKLQPAGNVLLAIHQRTTTSLYIDEAVIQDNNGNLITVKTDKVIGTNKELDGQYGNFGSYHPESIDEWNTIVFGFDIFKGVIWAYDNNGQIPVSDFGMKTYFKAKADAYLPYKDTVAILGAIDPYQKEYLISFPAVGGITAETWAFNFEKKEWVCKYDYYVDSYAHINNLLVSFKAGKLWVHNQDTSNYNKFHGTQYSRSITISVNPYPTRVKDYAAIQICAETLCQGDVAETVVVTATNKEGQSTYMKQKHFDKSQKIYYGPILKDLNTSSSLMTAGRLKLLDGKDMRSQSLEITITTDSHSIARHFYTNVTYVHSEYSV